MRKLIFVIPLLLFQSIWICCSDGSKRRPEQMNTIELEMQRDPQAALNILNNINHEMPNYSEQVRMEYELMLIQALDKTLHPLTSYKTKIDSVVRYFQKKERICNAQELIITWVDIIEISRKGPTQ